MEIKRYKKGDEHAILELFSLAFKQKMSLEAWKWRFLNNPFTSDVFIHLMWDGDKLVGHYAVSPVEMKINSRIEKTALSMTTMTHPDYGGRGIFSQLAQSLYDELREKGYYMVWGFPNNNSHYGFVKNLNWKDVAIIPMLSADTDKLRMPQEVKTDYEIFTKFTQKNAQGLLEPNSNVHINKTIDYLNWRYLENPNDEYKILCLSDGLNKMVYKSFKSFSDSSKLEIDILDINFSNDYNKLVELITSLLKEEPADRVIKINIWRSLFSKYRYFFEKIGFQTSLPLTYLSYLNLQSEETKVDNYKNWDVNLGYSDVF